MTDLDDLYARACRDLNTDLGTRLRESDDAPFRHVDGVTYLDAPLPGRWHRCKPQTFLDWCGAVVSRCACGGYRNSKLGNRWRDKNSRRRGLP